MTSFMEFMVFLDVHWYCIGEMLAIDVWPKSARRQVDVDVGPMSKMTSARRRMSMSAQRGCAWSRPRADVKMLIGYNCQSQFRMGYK